ncbi:MAG TPA: hypothetical protein VFO40_15645 [Chthoniobacterales bacterium]|nr:hypothetical protein [Chthoniobacterales bacterium]
MRESIWRRKWWHERRSVPASVAYIELENDEGHSVESVAVTCNKCGHCTESFGTGGDSIRRCLALLREECPNGEENWYNTEQGEGDPY